MTEITTIQPVVHVIDDDDSLRLALAELLLSMGYQVKTFESVADFQSNYNGTPGCLVLDVRLPGMSGMSFQIKLKENGLNLPVIFMTGHGDIPMSVRAMKEGAVDFLAKPFRDQDMLDAVSAALDIAEQKHQHQVKTLDLIHDYEQLTDREKQVFGFVASGLLNKQIAWELDLSEVTVKIYRASLMKKMKAKSVAALVKMHEALKSGEIT
jgi:FixJ family two-component response regulator